MDKSRTKVIIKCIRGTVFTLLGVIFTVLLLYQQYFSVDARYMRDNLEFLSEKMSELKVISAEAYKTHGINAVKYPLFYSAYLFNADTRAWTDSYIGSVKKVLEDGYENKDSEYNPYDTYARLVLQANTDEVQAVYNTFSFIAILGILFR